MIVFGEDDGIPVWLNAILDFYLFIFVRSHYKSRLLVRTIIMLVDYDSVETKDYSYNMITKVDCTKALTNSLYCKEFLLAKFV